jgi:hypothetical protein
MDSAKHRYNALPKSGASYPNNPINAYIINPRMHNSSLEVDAEKICGAAAMNMVMRSLKYRSLLMNPNI